MVVVIGLLGSPFASIRESAAFWVLKQGSEGPDDDFVERVVTDRNRSVVVSLLAEVAWLMRVATPLLGVCILAGLLDRTLVLHTAASEPDALSTAPAVS